MADIYGMGYSYLRRGRLGLIFVRWHVVMGMVSHSVAVEAFRSVFTSWQLAAAIAAGICHYSVLVLA